MIHLSYIYKMILAHMIYVIFGSGLNRIVPERSVLQLHGRAHVSTFSLSEITHGVKSRLTRIRACSGVSVSPSLHTS